jgi:hypothetical protein
MHSAKKEQREKLEQRLAAVRKRIDQAYTDKLDGKISGELAAQNSGMADGRRADSHGHAGPREIQPGHAFDREKDFRNTGDFANYQQNCGGNCFHRSGMLVYPDILAVGKHERLRSFRRAQAGWKQRQSTWVLHLRYASVQDDKEG